MRLSVGVEHIEDLKADFTQAFQLLAADKTIQVMGDAAVPSVGVQGLDELPSKEPIITVAGVPELVVA